MRAPLTATLVRPRSADAGAAPALADTAAPAYVLLYLALEFEVFQLLIRPPGFTLSVVVPALGLVVLAITPTARLRRISISWALVAYVLWLAISRLWTESVPSTDFRIRADLPSLLIVAMVAGTIRRDVIVRTLVAAFAGIGLWSLATSLVLPASRAVAYTAGVLEPQVGFRGTFGHKNHLGIFMVFGLCVVLALVRGRHRRPLALLMIGLVIGTRSATAGSGLLAVVFVWFWIAAIDSQRSDRSRSLLVISSFIAAVTAVLLAFRLLPTLLGIYQKDLTFSGRTTIWAEALATAREAPWRGYGYGGLWMADPPAVTVALQRRIGFDAAHAHNGLIAVLLEVGLIGLVLLAAFLASVVAMAIRCLRRPGTADLGRWALLTLVALALMSVSEPLFEGAYLGYVLVIWVVLSGALTAEARQRDLRSTLSTTWSLRLR